MNFFAKFWYLHFEPKIMVDKWNTCVIADLALLKVTDPNLIVYNNYEKQISFS
jgi:hypothetical protein